MEDETIDGDGEGGGEGAGRAAAAAAVSAGDPRGGRGGRGGLAGGSSGSSRGGSAAAAHTRTAHSEEEDEGATARRPWTHEVRRRFFFFRPWRPAAAAFRGDLLFRERATFPGAGARSFTPRPISRRAGLAL
jgi:hypothetical protein